MAFAPMSRLLWPLCFVRARDATSSVPDYFGKSVTFFSEQVMCPRVSSSTASVDSQMSVTSSYLRNGEDGGLERPESSPEAVEATTALSSTSPTAEVGCPLAGDDAASTKTDVICWQTRCVHLEMSLQKFRDQAQSIRELLREKVRLGSYFFGHFFILFIC